jgi:hypothetical protein
VSGKAAAVEGQPLAFQPIGTLQVKKGFVQRQKEEKISM